MTSQQTSKSADDPSRDAFHDNTSGITVGNDDQIGLQKKYNSPSTAKAPTTVNLRVRTKVG